MAYGTLRQGYGNHRLLENSKFIGDALTVDKYKMTARGIPFVHKDDPVCQITGEVYEVDDETLQELDYLEGHPRFYCREVIETTLGDSWIYFINGEGGNTVVENGDYSSYRERYD